MKIIVVILCIVALSCAIPINELAPNSLDTIPQFVGLDNENEVNSKRVVRQVAVNVGPVGVGVGPFGGVGVRVGNLVGIDVPGIIFLLN